MLMDRFLPNSEWAMAPLTRTVNVIQDFQSYQSLYDQNQQLRRELQQMKSWKEAALQLEQENARLLDLNKLQLDAQLTWISGIVRTDSGSPFRQSVLLNVGGQDGIQNGWAAMDGLGLVGRIAGVGERTSRVILLTDPYSQIPAVIQPSRENALVVGDNTSDPLVDFIENADLVRAGDRIVTSGNGGVLPPGLLIARALDAPLSIDASETTGVNRYTMVEVDDGDNEERPEVTWLLHNFTFTPNQVSNSIGAPVKKVARGVLLKTLSGSTCQ